MGKIPKFGYWELRVNSTIVLLVGAAVLVPLGSLYYRINNPEPDSYENYAFYEDSEGYYHPVKLSRYVQGAEEALKFYSEHYVEKTIFGIKEQPVLVPGTRVGIIKYSPDSLFVKIKVIGEHTSRSGWIPSLMIHDSFDSTRVVEYKYQFGTKLIQ